MNFNEYATTRVLKKLAEQPPFLINGVLTPERLEDFTAESCGLKLFYGLERLNEDIVTYLLALAEESACLEKMKAMQAGKVINFIEGFESEHRKVLHTATRDFFADKRTEPEAAEAAKIAYEEVKKIKEFVDKLNDENRFTDVVQIGIGGSVLGPQAMSCALECFSCGKTKRKPWFVSNVDPDDIASLVGNIDLSTTLVVVVSKSGTTLETATNEKFLKSFFLKQGLDPKNHFVAVTSKGSGMDNLNDYLEVFYIRDYVGGRFSATSPVGGVIIALTLGFSVYLEVLKGAAAMDKSALLNNPRKNLPLISALIGIWNRDFLNYPTLCIVPYSCKLSYFCNHLQQCIMESNGKSIDCKGNKIKTSTSSIIWGGVGTDVQHSFFQYLHQGTDLAPVMFIGFKQSQYNMDMRINGTTSQEKLLSNLIAQAIALAQGEKNDNPNKNFFGNRPSSVILADKLTPFNFGALLSFFEHKTAFEGFILGINSFDQEGDQLGKRLASKMEGFFAGKQEFSLGEVFLK